MSQAVDIAQGNALRVHLMQMVVMLGWWGIPGGGRLHGACRMPAALCAANHHTASMFEGETIARHRCHLMGS